MFRISKIIQLFLITLFLIGTVSAQTIYSRWNYSKEIPNNTEADAKIVNDVLAIMDNHATGVAYIYVRYYYPKDSDSSFTVYGIDNGTPIVYSFNPLFPDKMMPLERENEVIILTRDVERDILFRKQKVSTKVKKQVMIGGDGMISEKYRLDKIPKSVLDDAKKEVKVLDKAVKAAMSDNKVWYDKTNKKLTDAEKRKAILKIATKKDKASNYTKKGK